MGARKRRKIAVWILGLGACAVLTGTALLESPRIAEWYQDQFPPSMDDWNAWMQYVRRKQICCELGGSTAPPIDASVQSLELWRRTVTLSAGKYQRVEVGYEFTIYRRDQFVGKVKVTRVDENSASARVLFVNEGETITVGDNAATQI